MIFVTVGTHEQSFDRLIKCIDQMVENKIIKEEVVIQKGYSKYMPRNCKNYNLIGYEEMKKYIEEARIVVTHGGPASFIAPLSIGKIPIVVPRQYKYNEHVNDHQLEFAREIEKRMNNIIVAETEEDIVDAVINYEKKVKKMNLVKKTNNKQFIEKMIEEIKLIL